jgi:hypothetical protein
MKLAKKLLLLSLLGLNFSSCLVSDYARSMQVEIMKPGIFTIPETVRSVAVLNLDTAKSDEIQFHYFNGSGILTDQTKKYISSPNVCVDELVKFLREENYFNEVRNYGDTLSRSFSSRDSLSQEIFFKETKADLCILLNKCVFDVIILGDFGNVVENKTSLIWTLALKDDSLSYIYTQNDTLSFEDNTLNFGKRINNTINSSSIYLGRAFGAKVIPTWLKVERIYYKSKHPDMLIAEKYALNNDWLKAAEIWNKQSRNKNQKIAAKASFNMALACEMEGRIDAAIDWLVQSYSGVTVNGEEHQANCKHYISVLALRKKEIEKLDKQVRN